MYSIFTKKRIAEYYEKTIERRKDVVSYTELEEYQMKIFVEKTLEQISKLEVFLVYYGIQS